jgi:oxaloacetate decarboxylase alpha subunit
MNLERTEAMLRLLQRQEHVSEIAVEGDGWRLAARRAHGYFLPPMPPLDLTAEEEAAKEEGPVQVIRAALVGVYRAPVTAGGIPAPLRPGDSLEPGSAAGAIEALRIQTPITVEHGGTVMEVLVEDGDPVEYGQELLRIRERPPAVELVR